MVCVLDIFGFFQLFSSSLKILCHFYLLGSPLKPRLRLWKGEGGARVAVRQVVLVGPLLPDSWDQKLAKTLRLRPLQDLMPQQTPTSGTSSNHRRWLTRQQLLLVESSMIGGSWDTNSARWLYIFLSWVISESSLSFAPLHLS